MTLLMACTNVNKNSYIVPCQVPDEIQKGTTWIGLLDAYIENRDLLIICAEKVRIHNERK